MRLDIEAMDRYIKENGIDIAFMTTQVGYLFATTTNNQKLRLLCVAGEALSPLPKPLYTIMNGYGPTESTILSSYYLIDSDYTKPVIGKAVANTQLYVIDRDMNLLPQGIAGELLIAGEGLARSYLNPSEKDAARYLTFMGQRMYRTGDLCRWNEDGQLEYLGRIDQQVKLRGFRIELGEIESQALKFEGISQAIPQTVI